MLIATENKGKMNELREIFKDARFDLLFLQDVKEKMGEAKIIENAKSFEGNALIKAIVTGGKTGHLTLADDSGLCIEVLGGKPGIYSARYSKEGTDIANYEKVLREMKSVPEEKRGAYYNCTVAIYDPKSNFVETVSGQWRGRIAFKPRGTKSFGYGPIFLCEDHDFKKTNAEMDPGDLVGINHRGKAFRKAIEVLDKHF